jgi:hypothetical protein
MARFVGASRVAGLALGCLSLMVGCAAPPTPPVSPAPTGPSPTASGSAAGGPRIPPLLVSASSGDRPGLWRIDPNVPIDTGRATVLAPPGVWQVTPPAPGGLVALTSVGETPVRIVLARAAGTNLVPQWTAALPSGERWTDAKAECVSPAGTVAVGDAGLVLSTLDAAGKLALVPGQRDDLGECTWLDATTLLWDQEAAGMRAWTVRAAESVAVTIGRVDPTSGGDRIAWLDDATATVRVATFHLTRTGVQIGPEVGHLALGSGVHPSGLALSPAGDWLMGVGLRGDETLSIFGVTETGLVEAASIALSSIQYRPGDRVTWMPTP